MVFFAEKPNFISIKSTPFEANPIIQFIFILLIVNQVKNADVSVLSVVVPYY